MRAAAMKKRKNESNFCFSFIAAALILALGG